MIKRLIDKPIIAGIVTAIVTITYCGVIALFFMLIENVTNGEPGPQFFMIGFMLILFVLSAAVCGILVFGVPIFFLVQKEIRKAGLYMTANLLTFVLILIVIANVMLLAQIIQ